jgi:hypothetical protein
VPAPTITKSNRAACASAGMAGGTVAGVLLSKDGSGRRRCRVDPVACFGIRNSFLTVVNV